MQGISNPDLEVINMGRRDMFILRLKVKGLVGVTIRGMVKDMDTGKSIVSRAVSVLVDDETSDNHCTD